MSKLATLVTSEGYTDAFTEAKVFDSVCPGICKREGCNYTCDVEPDQDAGWCESCEANTVISGLLLAGVI